MGDLQKKSRRKKSYKYNTIGDLWGAQGLSQYEDKFEAGLRDEFAGETKRTCHLCNGEGLLVAIEQDLYLKRCIRLKLDALLIGIFSVRYS